MPENQMFYTVQELQAIFKIGRNNMYKMVNSKGFPAVRVGKRIIVPVDRLQEWVEKNAKGVDILGK